MIGENSREQWIEEAFGVENAGPFGGADDIPASIWGDPETFDAEAAAQIVAELTSELDDQTHRLTEF